MAVGPSAPPIMPMEAASWAVKSPEAIAPIKVMKIPN